AQALAMAEALLASNGARRRPQLLLAATRLRADALAALRGAGELPEKGDDSDPLQVAALGTAELAASQGLLFERADALYLAGQDLAARGRNEQALQRFEEALSVADAIGSGDLSTAIRERLVDIHGAQGNVAATSEVLQAIESQLTEEGANDELAQNLLAQGQILIQTFRYAEASDVLRQALEFEHNSATRNQVRLVLAEASWALGDLDVTRNQAQLAVINPSTGRLRRPTPSLDVVRGAELLAGVARAQGERSRLRELREAHREIATDREARISWAWSRAEDDLAEGGRPSAAIPFLRQFRDEAPGTPLAARAELARLWLCVLGTDCPAGQAAAARRALRAGAVPRERILGDWLYGRVTLGAGNAAAAARDLEALVRDMIFLRYSVPGVLGDHYWRYVDLITSDLLSARRATGRDDRLMMDLARQRWLRSAVAVTGTPFDARAAGLDTDAFRALLARGETPERGDDPATLARDIRDRLEAGRGRFDAVTPFLDNAALERWLSALEAGAVVLDFDLDATRPAALLGTAAGVRRFSLGARAASLGPREDLAGASAEASARVARQTLLERWNGVLPEPLLSALPGRVYLASGATLAYLPIEALTVPGGRSLGAGRSVVRLASFPARPAPAIRLGNLAPEQVFIAGGPVDFSAGYLSRLATGAELRAVMDRFVGPGLQVIQGAALATDEFMTEGFRTAEIVHLAVPARVATQRPRDSYLELSELRAGAGRDRLSTTGLSSWQLEARLLTFSQMGLVTPVATEAGRPPLVAEALSAGAGAVLATAWPGEDGAAASFFAAFYDALGRGEGLDQALMTARQEPGVSPEDANRYQLWVD
ncbi:MAG: CHAT domain-containing protein, partial [Pseudomonadota bacterium]